MLRKANKKRVSPFPPECSSLWSCSSISPATCPSFCSALTPTASVAQLAPKLHATAQSEGVNRSRPPRCACCLRYRPSCYERRVSPTCARWMFGSECSIAQWACSLRRHTLQDGETRESRCSARRPPPLSSSYFGRRIFPHNRL